MKLSDAAEVLLHFGPRDVSLLDLIDGWCGHVMKLADDAAGPVDDPWTVHDLIAALYLRDAVQRGLDSHTEKPVSISAVAAADQVYESLTIESLDGSLRTVDPDVPISPWWWKRVPARGPIAAELQRLSS